MARWKCRMQKIAKNSPSGHHPNYVMLYLRSEKNLLYSNISPTCPYSMVNFGPLAPEICWRVWGTPANFNGFRALAALLHGTLVVGVRQSLVSNRGRHLYSTGWPSRCALADILVLKVLICIQLIQLFYKYKVTKSCLQCFDAVGWAAGRASGL